MYLGVALNLAYDLMTLLTASRKSFSVAIFLRALMANIPASVHTLRISAPERKHDLRECSDFQRAKKLLNLHVDDLYPKAIQKSLTWLKYRIVLKDSQDLPQTHLL